MLEKNKTLPLISIIVPVYNVKDYLEKCLKSICGQTYQNLEIIVVDDGSTDGSGELCDVFAQSDSRIKVVHQSNGGLGAARNKGLDIAIGEYIGFVDSDDWIDSDMYQFLYELMDTSKADISICSHYVEKSNKTKIKYSSDKVLSMDPIEAIRLLAKDKIVRNYAWDKLFKRDLFKDLRFPENCWFEDLAVMYKVFYKAQKIVMQGRPKYHYLVRENSIMGSKYNPKKEYHLFLGICKQNDFIQEKKLWGQTPVFVIQRGVHFIDHMMLLPFSETTEELIEKVLSKLHQYDRISWRQLGIALAIKRFFIYYHLSYYRFMYRFFRLLFKSKRHRF